MEIETIVKNELNPTVVAGSLANSTPAEFADFWLAFYRACERKEEYLLDKFAKAMAPDFGGSGKNILFKLCRLITYYEIVAAKSNGRKQNSGY